ncbi:MAG: hypothetical protein AAF745_05725 [Planctomycetota bacterium]
MIVFLQILAILMQAVLLGVIVVTATAGGRQVIQRYLNPGCWLTFFYTLWFLIPQFVSITNDNFVIGFPAATEDDVLQSQWRLVVFLATVLIGLFATRALFGSWSILTLQNIRFRGLRRSEHQMLWLFYISGLIGITYLATQLAGTEDFRSVLVKTPPGMVATAVGFFGLYAMAVLTGHALYHRNYPLAILVVLVLGTAIFFTAARGRLLWPIVLGVAYVACRRNRINWGSVACVSIIGILVLLVFDPVFSSLRGGLRHFDGKQLAERINPANIFMLKRNFDGFANFTLISSVDSLKKQPGVIMTGARVPFMEHYFPEIFESGVGFGTTLPGMFWLAGGFRAMAIGGAAYGALLAVLTNIFHRIKREPMFWSYAFAMTWLAAVGGNFQESLDKMLALALPGFVWVALLPLLRMMDPVEPEPDPLSTKLLGS